MHTSGREAGRARGGDRIPPRALLAFMGMSARKRPSLAFMGRLCARAPSALGGLLRAGSFCVRGAPSLARGPFCVLRDNEWP